MVDLDDNDGDDVRGKEVGERGRDAFRQEEIMDQQTNCTLISVCDRVTHWASLKNLTKLFESMARATSTANRTSGECRTWSE